MKLAEFGGIYQRLVERGGLQAMSWPFHGRGLGDDLPVMPNAAAESDAVFAEGHVMILKPGVVPPGKEEDAGRARWRHRGRDQGRRQAVSANGRC